MDLVRGCLDPWLDDQQVDVHVRGTLHHPHDRLGDVGGDERVGHPGIDGVRAAGLAAGPMTGFDADGVDREFFPDGAHRTIAVVNIGRPAEGAWMDRLPRLDYDEVVTSV